MEFGFERLHLDGGSANGQPCVRTPYDHLIGWSVARIAIRSGSQLIVGSVDRSIRRSVDRLVSWSLVDKSVN